MVGLAGPPIPAVGLDAAAESQVMVSEGRREERQLVGRSGHVGVREDHEVAGRCQHARGDRAALAAMRTPQHAEPRFLAFQPGRFGERLDDRHRGVGRAVIDHEDIPAPELVGGAST